MSRIPQQSYNKALKKKLQSMKYFNRSRDSNLQHICYNKFCLDIILTEPTYRYCQKTTQVEHTHKNKQEVGELPHLLQNKNTKNKSTNIKKRPQNSHPM